MEETPHQLMLMANCRMSFNATLICVESKIEKRAKNNVVPAVVPFVVPQLSNQIKAMRPTHRDTRHPYLITSRFNISPRKPSTGYSESIAATIQSFGSGDCVESVGVRKPLGIIYFLCTRK